MPPSASSVTQFITKTTTVEEFYNFVTHHGSDFEYHINAGGRCGWTALQAACHCGNISLVRALLVMGADPNRARDTRATALCDAVRTKNLEIVQLLVEFGAVFRPESGLQQTLQEAKDPAIRAYISAHLQLLPETDYGESIEAIQKAILDNDVEELHQQLRRKGSLDMNQIIFGASDYCTRGVLRRCRDNHGQGNLAMVRLLAEYGDDIVEYDNADGSNLRYLHAELQRPDIIEFITTYQKQMYERLGKYVFVPFTQEVRPCNA